MAVQSLETKQVNITIEAGATFQMYFTVRDDNQSLIDLTGCTVEAQLREYPEAQDYFQFTATHNNSGGRVSITMQYEDTAAIPYSTGYYDVYITDSSNNREKYIWGEVTVVPAVTKPVAGEIIYLLSFAKEDDFPDVGIVRRIYFSHATNHMYRWNGTAYVSITTDGEAATVEVGDVTTLTAGSDATVENVGSLLNAVFDFGIPEGNGIASIELDSTSGLEKTYRVTFTDPSMDDFTFVVMDGAKGDPGTTTWEGITNKPETFPPSSHNHDDIYYTETEVDSLLGAKADASAVYTVTETNALLAQKADASDVYSKSATDDLLDAKADASDVYDKSDVDSLLSAKADTSDLGDLAYEDDAPSDDKPYARKNGAWAEVQGGSGGGSWGSITGNLPDQSDLAQALQSKADVIVSSASGSVASFPDGMSAPVTALSVGVEPVQDLHGQSNPYPAGGGKNLFDPRNTYSGNGLTTTANPDGSITISGKPTVNNVKCITDQDITDLLEDGVTYTFSQTSYPDPYYHWPQIIGIKQDDSKTYWQIHTQPRTFTVDKTTYKEYHSYVTTVSMATWGDVDRTITFKLQLEKSASATDWSPYWNICPISGHSSATVTRTGKNLFDKEHANVLNAYFNSSSATTITEFANARIVYLPCFENTVYTVQKVSDNIFSVGFTKSLPQIGTQVYSIGIYTTASVATVTSPSGAKYICVYVRNNSSSYTEEQIYNSLQIELGSIASSYEAYQGQQVTIPFGQTVYGGTLDVVGRTLTVDMVCESLTGSAISSSWADGDLSRNSIGFYRGSGTWSNTGLPSPVSDIGQKFDYCAVGGVYNNDNAWNARFLFNSSGFNRFEIRIPKDVLADISTSSKATESAQAYLNAHPLQAVYKVEPTVIENLTDGQISTLLGQNVIWASTGDVAVQYRADTKAYIDKVVSQTALTTRAMIADSATPDGKAPKSLASGDLIIVGDELRKCTSNIGSGSAITASNSTVATLADVIKALQ